jgi:hypothetical protein
LERKKYYKRRYQLLRVSVILEPYGQTPGTKLGSLKIISNTKGTADYGFYDVEICTGSTTENIKISGFKRSLGFWVLIRKIIQKLEKKQGGIKCQK